MKQSRGQTDEASLFPREGFQKDLPIFNDGDYAVVTKKFLCRALKNVNTCSQNEPKF